MDVPVEKLAIGGSLAIIERWIVQAVDEPLMTRLPRPKATKNMLSDRQLFRQNGRDYARCVI